MPADPAVPTGGLRSPPPALSDGTTRGGHLLEGRVFPTLEAIVTETPAELREVMRPDIGIALIDLDQSES